MKFKIILILLVFCTVTFGSYYLGYQLGSREWQDARQAVITDLQSRKLDSNYLGATEVFESSNKNITYGFTYNHNGTHLDYLVFFGGPRGIEISVWDHARED